VYVVDEKGHRYVGKGVHRQLPIASITKLMNALVFLEHNPGWERLVTIRPADDSDSSRVGFRNGEKITVRALFESMLVGSKNNAAQALARATGMGMSEFVQRMNAKARELGLHRTRFVDSTGLSAGNVSTAAEVAELARAAFAKKDIRKATMKAKYSFQAQNTRRWFTVRTTNSLLGAGIQLSAAKTGFINESGYNFVVETTYKGKRLFVVILGARDATARFHLASELIRFVHETVSP
jgi:D-alanyl-D-alanine endopeptidase (penicillin-binding protein 7)